MKNKIDYWRKRQGMSYRSIAEIAGTTAQYVSMLAKGHRRNPGLDVMRKIAGALGKKLEQVFTLGEETA